MIAWPESKSFEKYIYAVLKVKIADIITNFVKYVYAVLKVKTVYIITRFETYFYAALKDQDSRYYNQIWEVRLMLS